MQKRNMWRTGNLNVAGKHQGQGKDFSLYRFYRSEAQADVSITELTGNCLKCIPQLDSRVGCGFNRQLATQCLPRLLTADLS